uniref:PHD-type domain-containing protein n=1 Tax=Macrostomum lignano TaxID=282301 RepID=A0A1I8I4F7_9PLAT
EENSPQQPQQQQRPEAVVFASFYNASRRQPLLLASLADGADKSERLRGRGLSYQLSHPALLTKHRVRPLKPPAAAPAATPAWQLIRPRPRPTPPRRSGSDNDSDDGERGRGPKDDAEETSPIRAVEIESPFFDYMTSQSPDIFAESPLNQTRIVESADLRSGRRERGSASPPPSPPPPRPPRASSPPPPPPQPSAAVEKTVTLQVPQQRTRKTSRGSATEKPQLAVKSPTPLAVQNGAKSSQNNSVSDASKATTETKEQQAAAAMATQLQKEQPVERKRRWLTLTELIDCFHCLHVYHKVDTYQYRHSFSDLRGIASASARDSTPSKKSAGTGTGQSREVDRSLQDRGAGPVFLLVDSLEPSEIILSMSVLSRWPESYSVSLAASSARAGVGLDEVQRKPRDPPNPGSCVAELHNWKSPRLGQQFKRVRTSGTKAVSLSLPAGRHCLRLFARAPTAFVCCLASASQLWVGSEEEILPS